LEFLNRLSASALRAGLVWAVAVSKKMMDGGRQATRPAMARLRVKARMAGGIVEFYKTIYHFGGTELGLVRAGVG